MKKTYLLAIAMLCISMLQAQITLEHIYPNAGFYANGSLYNEVVKIVHLEVSGPKYMVYNMQADQIDFYNLDHTLYKSITFGPTPTFPLSTVTQPKYVLYVSELLFDLDNEIEFMFSTNFTVNTSSPTPQSIITTIYNEDGTVLFNSNTMGPTIDYGSRSFPYVQSSLDITRHPIYNTPEGTKMILSRKNGEARVFSLPGTLSPQIGALCPDFECPDCIFSQQGALRFNKGDSSGKQLKEE